MSTALKVVVALTLAVLVGLPIAATLSREKGPQSASGLSGPADAYKLVTVDRHPVPYAPMHQGQQAPEIVSSTIALNNDGTFRAAMTYGMPGGGSTSRYSNGTYAKNETGFAFNWEGAGQTNVTIEGNKLTMDNEGMLFVYQK